METRSQSDDQRLVQDCLAGSEEAWREFYCRFIGLMRSLVRKRGLLGSQDVEDITQSAFLSLTAALRTYDPLQSLPRFVCLVTERVLIDEYRKGKAAKRGAEIDASGDSERVTEDPLASDVGGELQDQRLETAEQVSRLRAALQKLDARCRELIALRYFHELSFKEIADKLGATENTVTVQTRRCLESLRAKFAGSRERGPRP
jgi:RNA polymerase sigma factor (sigma-70 family)